MCFKLTRGAFTRLPHSEQCFCKRHTLTKTTSYCISCWWTFTMGKSAPCCHQLGVVFSSPPTSRSLGVFQRPYYILPVSAVRSMCMHVQYIMCGMQYALNTLLFTRCALLNRNTISHNPVHSVYCKWYYQPWFFFFYWINILLDC